ncbi:MAG: hypothetical protein HY815_18265 [Candidatus Riflebacteria bacterium]|nr:hypothetical protein [Candidatus Riflebacteria bacterium]
MICKTCLAVLALLLIRPAAGVGAATEPPDPAATIRTLSDRVRARQHEISTINLLNGLNLNPKQAGQVLALARRAGAARQEMLIGSARLEDMLRQAEHDFGLLRAEIQKGAPARGWIPERAGHSEHLLMQEQRNLKEKLAQTLTELEKELEAVLSPEQAQIVRSFSPCLIPPPELNDPVRAGQAKVQRKFVDRFAKIRGIPELDWTTRREALADEHIERFCEQRFQLTDEEKKVERKRFLDLTEEVRKMTDAEFEMEKESVAARLEPEDKVKKLRKELDERLPHKRRGFSGLSEHLLDDRVVPILEERLGRGASPAAPVR